MVKLQQLLNKLWLVAVEQCYKVSSSIIYVIMGYYTSLVTPMHHYGAL